MIASLQGLAGVTLHDLYETYPNFLIDTVAEQNLLLQHDVVVFQHPFYWYSVPAIIREWCDLVLEYGFAYGDGGTNLSGKKWLHAISAGGPREAYARGGANRYSISEFLAPFDQTAALCHMTFLPPFVVYDTLKMNNTNDIPAAAEDYRHMIQALRDAPSIMPPPGDQAALPASPRVP